jgi:uroporphyrinogen-III synthase
LSLPVITVRPEPGATATAQRIEAAGLVALVAPLFTVVPLAWTPPDPLAFDAVLLTSANAVRHGGNGLARYNSLPCWCIGSVTAAMATAAGFAVDRVGDSDAAALLAEGGGSARRWLWLSGARHQPLVPPTGGALTIVPVYENIDLPVSAVLQQALKKPSVLMAHSAAAARRLDGIVADRHLHHLVAMSAAVAAAAGTGWRSCNWPDQPDDREMVVKAATLCMDARHE